MNLLVEFVPIRELGKLPLHLFEPEMVTAEERFQEYLTGKGIKVFNNRGEADPELVTRLFREFVRQNYPEAGKE